MNHKKIKVLGVPHLEQMLDEIIRKNRERNPVEMVSIDENLGRIPKKFIERIPMTFLGRISVRILEKILEFFY